MPEKTQVYRTAKNITGKSDRERKPNTWDYAGVQSLVHFLVERGGIYSDPNKIKYNNQKRRPNEEIYKPT